MSRAPTPRNPPIPAEIRSLVSQENAAFFFIAFGKSPAALYPDALKRARAAHFYREAKDKKGKILHLAGFSPTEGDARLARQVFELVKGWKSAVFISRGRVREEKYRIIDTLQCYEKSFRHGGPADYCTKAVTVLPTMEEVGEFFRACSEALFSPEKANHIPAQDHGVNILPCKLLAGFALTGRFGNDPAHADHLILETAARRSCDWCPRFDIKKYVRVYGKPAT